MALTPRVPGAASRREIAHSHLRSAGPRLVSWAQYWFDRATRGARRSRQRALRALRSLQEVGPGREAGLIESATLRGGTLSVSGWACSAHPVAAVLICVEGVPAGLAVPGARAQNQFGQTGVSWSSTMMVEHLLGDGGSLRVSAMTVSEAGLAESFGDMKVKADPPERVTRALVRPEEGSMVTTTVQVVGWTLASDLEGIEVEVGGASDRLQPMSMHRPDVGDDWPELAHSALSGFTHTMVVPAELAGQRVTVKVDEVDRMGRRTKIGRSDVVVADPTSGSDDVDPDDERFLAALRARVTQSAEVVAGRRSVAGHHVEHDGARVLAVTDDLGYGGGQLYLGELLHGLLDDYGFGCSVVSPSDGPLRHMLEERGATVHIAGPYMTSPPAYESLMREMALLATDAEVDVVLVNALGAFCGVDLAHRLRLPALWAIHESHSFDPWTAASHGSDGVHPYFRDRARLALSSASAVLFDADDTRDIWVPNGDPRRFLRVNCGVPVARIDEYKDSVDRLALRHAQGITDQTCVLLCVGTIEPTQAQAVLVRVFVELSEKYPDAVLVLLGDHNDPFGTAVLRYVESLDLADRIRVLSGSCDAYPWYHLADAFVLSSTVESLPRAVLEAMAFGLPVLTVDAFGLSEVITDGVSGFLVPPSSPAGLRDGLERLIASSESERTRLGQRGSEVVRARYQSTWYLNTIRALLWGLVEDPQALPEVLLGRA